MQAPHLPHVVCAVFHHKPLPSSNNNNPPSPHPSLRLVRPPDTNVPPPDIRGTMDSMRHLSTSLPQTRRRRNDAPELLADFKAAALSVTNLYKTAAASQSKARDAGYQDALDDLLAFLDRENMGLMDGEGWRVRQWATERLVDDGRVPDQQQRQSSDEEAEEDVQGQRPQRAESRSSSPEVHRKVPPMQNSSSEVEDNTLERRTTASEPPQSQPPSNENFTFRSSHAYPTNHDRESGMDLDPTQTNASTSTTTPAENAPPNVRLVSRAHGRGKNHHSRRGNNAAPTATLNFNLGAGAGSKRKMPYQDFFDISGFSTDRSQDGKDGKDGERGGKRGRHV